MASPGDGDDKPHERAARSPAAGGAKVIDKPMPPSLSKHAGSWPAAVQHNACPTDDTLIALVEHALPADAMASLADHVDSCERCRATIGTLAAVDGGAKPRKVGRYELEDQLGVGGMGVVYAAFDPSCSAASRSS